MCVTFVILSFSGHGSSVLTPLLFKAPKPLIIIALGFLWLFVGWEIFRLWRSRDRGNSWRQLLFARYYRLSTAARVLGFSGGVLYTLHDAWTYTSVLKRQVQSLWQLIEQPAAINLFLSAALLCGIGVTLLLMRLFTGKTLKVVCSNDICRTEN